MTLRISHNENKRTEQLDEQRIFDERRLKVIPYLDYSFRETDEDDCSHYVTLGTIESDSAPTRKRFMTIEIENFGLEAACDISIYIYVGEKLECHSSEVVKILPANKDYKHLVCFEAPECEEELVFDLELFAVIFYKDLLGNQYVQEISGSAYDYTGDGFLYVNFFKPYAARVIPGEIYYKLPPKANSGVDLEEFIAREFEGYSCESNEAIDEAFGLDVNTLFNEIYDKEEKLLIKYSINSVKDLRGDFYGAKKINDQFWDMIFLREHGMDSLRCITYFVVVRYDRTNKFLKATDLKIVENTLIEGKEMRATFNKYLQKKLEKRIFDQIGNSEIAVKFEVVEKPNDWIKDIKKKPNNSPILQARYDYWTAFNDYAFNLNFSPFFCPKNSYNK